MLFQVCGRLNVVHGPSLNAGISAPAASPWKNFHVASMLASMRFDAGGGGGAPPAPVSPPVPVLPPAPVASPPPAPVEVGLPVVAGPLPVVVESVVDVVGAPPAPWAVPDACFTSLTPQA